MEPVMVGVKELVVRRLTVGAVVQTGWENAPGVFPHTIAAARTVAVLVVYPTRILKLFTGFVKYVIKHAVSSNMTEGVPASTVSPINLARPFVPCNRVWSVFK